MAGSESRDQRLSETEERRSIEQNEAENERGHPPPYKLSNRLTKEVIKPLELSGVWEGWTGGDLHTTGGAGYWRPLEESEFITTHQIIHHAPFLTYAKEVCEES